MTRAETYAALLAVVLASLSVVSIGGRPRPVLALAAVALLAFVGYARLRRQAVSKKRKKDRAFDAYERALQIQEERERKYGGR